MVLDNGGRCAQDPRPLADTDPMILRVLVLVALLTTFGCGSDAVTVETGDADTTGGSTDEERIAPEDEGETADDSGAGASGGGTDADGGPVDDTDVGDRTGTEPEAQDAPSAASAACDALVALLLDAEFMSADDEVAVPVVVDALRDVSPRLGELGTVFETDPDEVSDLEAEGERMVALDDASNEACGVPFVSAALAVSDAMTGDEATSFPAELPCFEPADRGVGYLELWFIGVDCDTGEAVRWDPDAGDWAATEDPYRIDDFTVTESFEPVGDTL